MEHYIGTPIEYLLISILIIFFFGIWNGLINKQIFDDKTSEQKRATSNT